MAWRVRLKLVELIVETCISHPQFQASHFVIIKTTGFWKFFEVIVIPEHRMFGLYWYLRSGQWKCRQVQKQCEEWWPHLLGLQFFSRYWVWTPLNVDVLEVSQEFEILQRFALPASLCHLTFNRNKTGTWMFVLKWNYFACQQSIFDFIGARIAFKVGRMLPEFNCFHAKGMAGQRWVLTTLVEAREFL